MFAALQTSFSICVEYFQLQTPDRMNTFEFMKVMGTDKISLTAGPAVVKGVLYIRCQVKFSLPLHTVIL